MSPCLLLLGGRIFSLLSQFLREFIRDDEREFTQKKKTFCYVHRRLLCARVSQFVLSCRISRSRGAKNYKNFIFPSPDLSHCWQWFRDFSEFVNSASAPNPKISLGVSERSVQSTYNSERGSTCARHTANNKFSVAYNALKRYFFSRKNTTARKNECEVKYGRNLEQQTLH